MDKKQYEDAYDAFDEDWDVELVDIPDSHDETHSFSSTASSPQTRESSLIPRFTRQQRRTQLLVTGSLVVTSLLALLITFTPVSSLLTVFVPQTDPSPTAGGLRPRTYIYIAMNPSWGQLLVDGKQIPHSSGDIQLSRFNLKRGTHTIDFSAPPFQPLHCTLSMPPDLDKDTCQIERLSITTYISSWRLTLSMSLLSLPNELRSSLIEETQAALDLAAPSTLVEPGESYVVSTGPLDQQLLRAKERMKATLHFRLDPTAKLTGACPPIFNREDELCVVNGQDCHIYCPANGIFYPFEKDWDVLGVASPYWEYRTLDGRLVGRSQIGEAGRGVYVPLLVRWNGRSWYVHPFRADTPSQFRISFDPLCALAMNTVRANAHLNHISREQLDITWSYVPDLKLSTLGCLAMAIPQSKNSEVKGIGYSLYRFGTFIAANEAAHQFWPDMPMAEKSEQKIVEQLVDQKYTHPIRGMRGSPPSSTTGSFIFVLVD